MSQTGQELLIIYEREAEQWATYLHSVFAGPISEAGICRYDIATVSSRRDDFLRLTQYTCKLLILSNGMLEGLCQLRRFFLARVLTPAARVVVLLCGVDSLTRLLDLVPVDGNECLLISSEQDAQEYLSTVMDIVRRGVSASAANINLLARKPSRSERKARQTQSTEEHGVRSGVVVVPPRVPCRSSMEVFILLRNEEAASDAEVEFTGENQTLRVKPVQWNERILCINAPDFPAGSVKVTVYSNGVPLGKAQLQYYSNMEEISSLLERAADPVDFMCQALQESSVEKLDQKLSSMLLDGIPTGRFQGLRCENTSEGELHHADAPSLLHFAARYGFRGVSSLLLHCPGAERALRTANRHGQTPVEIAKSHGHSELHDLLKETLNSFCSDRDDGVGVYETMCGAGAGGGGGGGGGGGEEEEEEIYAPLEGSDEYDTILKSTKAMAIANRPPAPTPRPESTQVKEDRTPYITKVFQKKKKKTQADADLYSLPTKQEVAFVPAREDRASSACDAAARKEQLIGLQQRMRAGLLPAGEALKGAEAGRQDKRTEVHNREDDVYDEIHIVHHATGVAVNESHRAESDFYSRPLKGQNPGSSPRAGKQ